jgi:dienelactone hydrolase
MPMRIFVYLVVAALAGLTGCAHKQKSEGGAAEAAAQASAPGAVRSEEITYQAGDTQLKGYLAYPAALTSKRPGVLIVHEWWGLSDYVRSRANALAELGYVAFALDMYGDGKNATHPEDAKKFMNELMSNQEAALQRFQAGKQVLVDNPNVDTSKIAALGYCMGGAVALTMARQGSDIALIGSFHGILATDKPMQPGTYKGKIFVATGGADPFVPPEQVAAFKQEMDAAGADYELVEYPGAKHAFTNPGATAVGEKFQLPLAYDASADHDSWGKFSVMLQTLADS